MAAAYFLSVSCATSYPVALYTVAAGKINNRSYDLEWNLLIDNDPDAAKVLYASYIFDD